MLRFEELPENNEELAKLAVSFPTLPDETERTCPVKICDILEYLALECEDNEGLEPEALTFIRTAQVGEKKYWIWRFNDAEGAECYATVSLDPDGSKCTGFNENIFELTPEQYMLGEYYNCF